MPADAAAGAAAGGMDIGVIIQDIAGGGIGGAIAMSSLPSSRVR